MKRLSILAIGFFCGLQSLHAAEDPRLLQIKEKVQQISQAVIHEDFDNVVDLTFPKLVEMVGGRQKMLNLLKAGAEDMKSKGVAFKSVEVSIPTSLIPAENDLFVIVPTSTQMSTPNGRIIQKSFQIGISSDQGKSWTFVDGHELNNGNIHQILPNFPSQAKLPEKQAPVFENK